MFYSKIICVLIVIVVMNMWIKDGSFIARKHLFRLPPMQCMHSDYAVCSDLAELIGKKKITFKHITQCEEKHYDLFCARSSRFTKIGNSQRTEEAECY